MASRPFVTLGRAVAAVALLLALAGGWAGWQAYQGARDLRAAADQLRGLRSQLLGGSSATADLAEVGTLTRSGRGHLEDPVLRALGLLPVIGDPVDVSRAASVAADLTVREALVPLADAAGADPVQRLSRGPGRFDLDVLAALAQPAARAAEVLDEAQQVLEEAPASSRLAVLDEARDELTAELADVRSAVRAAAVATRVGPLLLGQDRLRRYLVISQTPAEARGTGGLIGGYSVLEAQDGVLRVVDAGTKTALRNAGRSVIDLGPEFEEHYGQNGPTEGWLNSNLSPHFPYAARTWLALWEAQGGPALDGAVALDPIALSYLLSATGPLPHPDGSQVSADTVVDATLRDVYARYDDDRDRDLYLQGVQGAVTTALTTRDVAVRPLVEALSKAAGERRLLLWSSDDQVQSVLEGESIAGTLPASPAVGDVHVDAGGSKLDYYLERDLTYIAGCGGPSRLELVLRNTAPTSGLPDYVSPAMFRPGSAAGTIKLLSNLYLPAGSTGLRLTQDGAELAFRQGTELDLVWAETYLLVEPGTTSRIEVSFDAPEIDGGLSRVEQPLVRPESFRAVTC